MIVTLNVETADGVRRIEAAVNSLDDLQPALKRWNKYFRKKVQAIFNAGGPGWAPRKEETENHKPGAAGLQKAADDILRRKLRRDVKRARAKVKRGTGTAAALARRYAVLDEFEHIAGGTGSARWKIKAPPKDDARLSKSVRGLRDRAQRAEETASARVLGKVASSIRSKLTQTSVTVESGIDWAGIHNDGGTAGHGANIPKRTFLDITDADLEVLATLIEEQVSGALEG